MIQISHSTGVSGSGGISEFQRRSGMRSSLLHRGRLTIIACPCPTLSADGTVFAQPRWNDATLLAFSVNHPRGYAAMHRAWDHAPFNPCGEQKDILTSHRSCHIRQADRSDHRIDPFNPIAECKMCFESCKREPTKPACSAHLNLWLTGPIMFQGWASLLQQG